MTRQITITQLQEAIKQQILKHLQEVGGYEDMGANHHGTPQPKELPPESKTQLQASMINYKSALQAYETHVSSQEYIQAITKEERLTKGLKTAKEILKKKMEQLGVKAYEFENVMAAFVIEPAHKQIKISYKEVLEKLLNQVTAELAQATRDAMETEKELKRQEEQEVFKVDLKKEGVLDMITQGYNKLVALLKGFVGSVNKFTNSVNRVVSIVEKV